MESCAVCMDNVPRCHLVCGHTFCFCCVKEWYFKSEEPSCPMCRRDMYFKGMYKQIDEWEEEKQESIIEEVYSDVFDSICEDFLGEDFEFDFDEDDVMTPHELMLEELMILEDKFKKFMLCGRDWNAEVLFEVLNDPFCEPSVATDHYAYEKSPKKIDVSHQIYRKLTPREAKRCRESSHDFIEVIYIINICPL